MKKEEKQSPNKRLGLILMGIGGVLLIISIGILGFQKSLPQTEEAVSQKEAIQEKASVVASFYPIYFFAQQIGGDAISVHNLSGSRDVHSYTPTPKEVTMLMNADLVLYQSEYLEGWVKDIVPQLEEKEIPSQALLEIFEEEELQGHKDEEDFHEHDEHEEETHEHEEESHEHDEHEEESHEHDHGGIDPHTWLDPILAIRMVEQITESLKEVDSENASLYETNASRLREKLQELDRAYTSRLRVCDQSEVIVSHQAYGHLARRYEFTTNAIAGLSTLDQPSAQTMLTLKEEAQEGVTHILVEKNSVEDFAQTLSQETGLELAYINPLGRGPLDEKKDFFDVMYDNLDAFALGLGCDKGVE